MTYANTNKRDKSGLFLTIWKIYTTLPEPVPEYRFHPVRKFRFDFAFPAPYKVAVEIDGGVWLSHGGRHGTDRDREKLNLAASLGWLVLRFSPGMLADDPVKCCALVIDAINRPPG